MAVAKRKEVLAPPGVTNIPVYLKDMQGSRGSEEVGSNDLIIPRLELCQALSPCLKKNDPAYIDGIEEGMLYNNVTREIYGVKESVVICPVMFKKEYLLWRDRKDTGGFYGAYSSFEEAEEKRATLERPEKVEAVDTHQQLCLLVKDNGGMEEIAISMARSKRKVSKARNSLIRINGGDRFSRLYTVSSVTDKSGQDEYQNFKITNLGFAPETTYEAGVKLYAAIKAGVVTVDRGVDDEQAGADVGDGPEY